MTCRRPTRRRRGACGRVRARERWADRLLLVLEAITPLSDGACAFSAAAAASFSFGESASANSLRIRSSSALIIRCGDRDTAGSCAAARRTWGRWRGAALHGDAHDRTQRRPKAPNAFGPAQRRVGHRAAGRGSDVMSRMVRRVSTVAGGTHLLWCRLGHAGRQRRAQRFAVRPEVFKAEISRGASQSGRKVPHVARMTSGEWKPRLPRPPPLPAAAAAGAPPCPQAGCPIGALTA